MKSCRNGTLVYTGTCRRCKGPGLPIVPYVLWHGAPAAGGPRDRPLNFCLVKSVEKKDVTDA